MKIDTVYLTAFRSFVGIDLPLDAKRILIAGLNGVGKTSVREAIKYALTGRCDVTDGRGSGTEYLVPQGESGVTVAVDLAGVGRVSRAAKNGSSAFGVAGWTGQATSQQQALYDRLETSPGFLEAVLDTSTFLRLGHADAKSLVLNLLNVRLRLTDDETAPVYTLDELDALYDDAFQDRKVAKAKLRSCALPPKPAAQEWPILADVDRQLAVLRDQLRLKQDSVAEVKGRRETIERELTRVKAVAAAVPDAAPWESLISQLEERLAIMEADATEGSQPEPAPSDPQRLVFLKGRVAALSVHDPEHGCVIEGAVPCKTAKLAFRKRIKELQTEIEATPSSVAQPSLPTVNPLTAVRKELEHARSEKQRIEGLMDARARAQEANNRLVAELSTLQDTSAVDEEIQTLKGRIQKGETLRKAVETSLAQSEAYDKAVDEKRVLEADVARLEALCDALGPNGVRVQALQDAIGRFEAAVNTFTAAFGLELHFGLDPWEVRVNDRLVQTYSKSEQYRIGLALQLAIAALSGLSFAIVDETDMLTEANKKIVTKMLLEAPLEQIIILGAREPSFPLPAIPGVVAYRLDKTAGRTVVVERSAA